MPRNISVALQTHIAGDLLTCAYLAKMTLQNASVMGFSSFDRDLIYLGTTYEAGNSLSLTSIVSTLGLDVDNCEVKGILQSTRMTDADIQAGLYDGAIVEIYQVNWTDLTMGHVYLGKYLVGEITTTDGQHQTQLNDYAKQKMQQQIGEVTSRTCRVQQWGDARCKMVATATDPNTGQPYQRAATVGTVTDSVTLSLSSNTSVTGYYGYGLLKFTSGLNAGYSREIKQHTLVGGAAALVLQEAFPYTVTAGDTGMVTVGCDRLFGTCVTKFNNAVNHRAEPNIPGSDFLASRGRGG